MLLLCYFFIFLIFMPTYYALVFAPGDDFTDVSALSK